MNVTLWCIDVECVCSDKCLIPHPYEVKRDDKRVREKTKEYSHLRWKEDMKNNLKEILKSNEKSEIESKPTKKYCKNEIQLTENKASHRH